MTASFLTVPVPHTFHIVHSDAGGHVIGLKPVAASSVRINAGFFALRPEIFDYMRPGEELVVDALRTSHRRASSRRTPLRRLLEGDGHVQGQA